MKNTLLKKFFSFSYGSWIGLIIGFLATIVTTRILSPEDFGKASMFTLAINIFMILIIFGTDQSFVRFFYEEKEENRGGLLFNCLRITTCISLFVILMILVFYKQLSMFLFEEQNLKVILVLILGILAQVFYRYGSLVIRMQQKGNKFSILEILNRVVNFIFIVILYLLMGKNYEIIIYSTVMTLVILALVSIYFEKEYWNFNNFFRKNLKHSKIEIIKYSFPLVLTTLITWLFQSFDRIAIKHWSSYGELGIYSAAFKIVALLSIIQVTFSTFWTPVCYENFEKNPGNRNFYKNIFKIVSFGMFFVAIACIAGKELLVLFLGKEYREAANIMPFLVFMPIMYTLSETTVIGINFYKKPKWHILIAGIVCFINIIGNWALVPKYGAVGAAISTAFAYILFFSLRTHISLRYYKINYGLKKVYLMIFVIFSYAVFSITNTSIYINLLVGAFVLLVMLILYYKDLIDAYKKQKYERIS
ncbi:oligosaccharide flippase family protein [Clostridium sp.]|uniref:lipopolysaccharide biosynthesis protein n=1 Tax=Clostridium sp. TaxID=1506 RepID=UPI003D6CE75C